MTQDDIIRMAREAEFKEGEIALMGDNFIRFANLVAEHEREECATVAENIVSNLGFVQAKHSAGVIRARGVQ